MNEDEARFISHMVESQNHCDVEADGMVEDLGERFPEFPWKRWAEEARA